MRKSVSVCCVFSFGEKVSGFGFQVSGPPWCDSESIMLMQSKPGLGQGVRIEKLKELKPEH